MSSPLRFGIIGCGDVCDRKSGPALATVQGSALVAVTRRDATLGAAFAARYAGCVYLPSVAALLAEEAVSAVYVASPPALHAEHTLAALAAGKRLVLCEKPLAMRAAECDVMIAAASAAGASLYCAFYRVFYPKWRTARALLRGGCVGTILGARLLMTSEASPIGWRVDPSLSGGGYFLDMGSHRLNMLEFLLGQGVAEVMGAGANNLVGHHAAENDVVLAMRMAGGALVSAAFHFSTPGAPRDVLEIYGTQGSLVADPFDGTELLLNTAAPGGVAVTTHSFATPAPTHGPLVDAIVRAHVAGMPALEPLEAERAAGVEPPTAACVDAAEGAKTTRVMDAALATWRGEGK